MSSIDIAAVHRCIGNRLDAAAIGHRLIAGIVGDGPSHYSKSPALWNASFTALGMDAVYLPFDVAGDELGNLLQLLKNSERFLGLNVTVPHKVRVMDFLDKLDNGASRIQAVNTVVRDPSGNLTGYNTDGPGFIESLLTPAPGQPRPFLDSVADNDVLLLGAGGSARAVAYHLSDYVHRGCLYIANRTMKYAEDLAGELKTAGANAAAIGEPDIPQIARRVGLIVNCSTKGQGGVRHLADGRATLLEPYSSLAPANPPSFDGQESNSTGFQTQFKDDASDDIAANNNTSMMTAASIPASTRFYDLIYHPEETVFLRHGRETGHPTQNGQSMIVYQAVIAFFEHICRNQLIVINRFTRQDRDLITRTMFGAW